MTTPRHRRGWGGSVSAACILAVAISGAPLPLLTAPAHARSENAGGNGNGGGGNGGGGGRSEEARGGGVGGGGGQGRSDQAPGRSGASGGGNSENAGRGNAGRSGGSELRLFGQTIRLGAPGQGAGAARGGSESRATTRAAAPRSTAPTARAPMTSRAPAERPDRGAGAERHGALAGLLGAHPSELGALNAARASEQAFANASPDSRIGRIAAYRDSVLAGEALAEDLEAALAALDALPLPSSEEDIQTAIDTAEERRVEIDDEILALEALLEPLLDDRDLLLDPDYVGDGDLLALQDEIDDLLEDIATLVAELGELPTAEEILQAEADAAAVRAEAEALITELELALEDQPEIDRALLEAAANKPVTAAVEAEVRRLLGLD